MDYPDFVAYRLRGSWPRRDWMSQRDGILAVNGDLDQNDVALMLCFAADKMPTGAEYVAEEETPLMEGDILGQVLGYLEQLPADAPEWKSDVPGWLLSVEELVECQEGRTRVGSTYRRTPFADFRVGPEVTWTYWITLNWK